MTHLARRLVVALHGRTRGAAIAAIAAGLVAGCAGSSADRCAIDDDCASHFCRADGTCAPEGPDAAPTGDGAPGADASTATCTPNHDGILQRAELPLAPGRTATYKVVTSTTGVTVDTAGTQAGSGQRAWDLATAIPGDADKVTTLLSPTGTWWATTFPTASYATTLSASSTLLGVFQLDGTGLRLLGVVSPDAGVTRTELTYDPPVTILPLPMAADATWTTTSTVTGLASGITSFYSEKYASRVDAVGTLGTPYGDFPVVRVAIDLTRTVGAAITTSRTFSFVSECYGPVGTIVSQNYETGAEFTTATEVRRLAP
ncbi:MAG: hypothetical protein K8W52_06000 [Deltaproteobacteria bacterium]|nr:hypothetical protein [Deltaproteobacteria bacterium]